MTAVTKLAIFENRLKAKDVGLEGKEKPNTAHTPNTKNMAARENRVYLDRFSSGDSVIRAKLEISTINTGRK